jgi:hypothetical protein
MAEKSKIARSYRELAARCERNADQAGSREVREGYERMAGQWRALATQTERVYGAG